MIGRDELRGLLSSRGLPTLIPFVLLCLLGGAIAVHAAEKPAGKPGEKPDATPAQTSTGKPPAKPEAKPEGKPGGRPPRATPVKVAEAQRMILAPETLVAGTVISRDEVRLATEVAGKLLMVVKVGDKVQAGQSIARIDATFIQLKIEEYKAAVQSEQASLGFLDSEMKRLNRLAKQNNAAQTRLEEVRANRQVARSKLQIAKTRLKRAEEENRRHKLVAPFTGVVVERYIRPGERAKLGDEVLRLIDINALEVQARIPLYTRDFVAEGDMLTLKSGGRSTKARVRALVAAGDERSRLLELRIAISGEGWTIGQPVRIAIPTAVARDVLAVPRDALVLRRDGARVYRINGENKAQPVPVKLGVASGSFMEVTGKLQPGDMVVIRGGERLRPGAVVKILPDDPPRGPVNDNTKPDDKPRVIRGEMKPDGKPGAGPTDN